MKRTLNWKLLLWTVGVVFLAGGCVHFVHAFQVRRNAGSLLGHADRARAAGELEQALAYYSHYLTFEPGDIDAFAKFGLVLERKARTAGDRLRVVLTFQKILQRDPARADIRFRLIHSLLGLPVPRLADAIDQIQILLPQWGNKAELYHMLGWCQEAKGKGEYGRAVESFRKAIELAPGRIESYVLLAEVLETRLDQPAAAAAVMDDLVRANDKTAQAYLVRSRCRQQQGEHEQAEADLNKALELGPKEPEVLLAAAEWALAKGDLDKARTHLHKGWEAEPKSVVVLKALAGLEMRAGRRGDAVTILRTALKDLPQANDLHILLADLLLDQGQLTEAAHKIDELRKSGIPSALPDFLEGRLAVERGQWTQALTLLERARAGLENSGEWSSRVHALLGLVYRQLGDHEQELASFRRAVRQEPTWAAARFGLASALLGLSRLDECLAELQLVEKAADAPAEVWVLGVRALISRNWRRPEPLRNWSEAEAALDKAVQKTPEAVELPLLRAEILTGQNKDDEARDVLDKARATRPGQLVYWTALAGLAARRNQWPQALALLDQAEKKLGDSIELRLARCLLWGHQGTAEARHGLDGLAAGLERFPLEARTRLLRELAETWARLGDSPKAEALWQHIAHENPRDPRSRFALFEAALQGNQPDQARAWLAELRQLEGDEGNLWRYGTAALLVSEARGNAQKLEEARKALDELARKHKDSPRIPLLQAGIDEQTGRLDLAIEHYTRAVDLGESQPRVVARLVELLVSFKRFDQAEQVLHKIEERMPLPPELARVGAEVAVANLSPTRARQLAQLAFSPSSRDYRDHLWLARLYHGVGDDKKAEDILRQVVVLAPHTPDSWIALAEQLTRIGQRGAAESVVLEAKSKVPFRLQAFTLARCYEAMGLLGRAEDWFRQGLKQSSDDFSHLSGVAEFFLRADQPDKAETFLRELLTPSSAAPAEYQVRARRQLALVLAGTGKSADRTEALALLDLNLKVRPDSAADVRARAYVQANDKAQRNEAIRVFEDSAKRQPLSAEEQLLVARLLDAAGDQTRAREQALGLLSASPENPQFLAFYVSLLLKSEDRDEVRRFLHKLERLEPDSRRTLELKKLAS